MVGYGLWWRWLSTAGSLFLCGGGGRRYGPGAMSWGIDPGEAMVRAVVPAVVRARAASRLLVGRRSAGRRLVGRLLVSVALLAGVVAVPPPAAAAPGDGPGLPGTRSVPVGRVAAKAAAGSES